MDNRIKKVREDIRRAEAKRREMDEYIKTLKMRERQLCDEEILKTVRSMAGKGDVLDTLKELSNKTGEKPESKAADLEETKRSAAFFMENEREDENDQNED